MAEPEDGKTVDGAVPEDQMVHQMYVGGVSLVRDGRFMANAYACCAYDNMSFANVQGMWRFLASNPRVQAAVVEFSRVLAAELTDLGDAMGLVRGKVTEAEMATNLGFLADLAKRTKP